MTSTTELYKQALLHHRAGELEQARELYGRVLRIDSRHADALHLLGVLAHQQNDHQLAIENIQQAININGGQAAFHSNLGAAYRAVGKLDAALKCLESAIDVDPSYAEAHRNLGVLLLELGRPAEAESHFRRARELNPQLATPQTASEQQKYCWEGVYSTFDEVPVVGKGHDGYNWAQATLNSNRRLLSLMKTYGTIPLNTTGMHNLLPMLVGQMSQSRERVRVMDFGGATGTGYLHTLGAVERPDCLDFHIVETASACELGEGLLGHDSRVRFHRELATVPRPVDLVHINSSLQYIRDYRTFLEELADFQPQYMLFVRLSAGDIPSYATAQMNLWDDVVPYWFLNVQEVIGIVKSTGYQLLFKGADEHVIDQSNFPAEYRIGRTCHLLFGRVDPRGE